MSPGYAWTAPLAVASIVFFVMFFGLGMGPIPWLLPSEVRPEHTLHPPLYASGPASLDASGPASLDASGPASCPFKRN
eukprot:1452166-Pleurochrysis_carterae.AAC.1